MLASCIGLLAWVPSPGRLDGEEIQPGELNQSIIAIHTDWEDIPHGYSPCRTEVG